MLSRLPPIADTLFHDTHYSQLVLQGAAFKAARYLSSEPLFLFTLIELAKNNTFPIMRVDVEAKDQEVAAPILAIINYDPTKQLEKDAKAIVIDPYLEVYEYANHYLENSRVIAYRRLIKSPLDRIGRRKEEIKSPDFDGVTVEKDIEKLISEYNNVNARLNLRKMAAGETKVTTEEFISLVNKLKSNGGLNYPSSNGNTALHWAIRVLDLAKTRILLQAGADPEIKNSAQKTPRQLVADINDPDKREEFTQLFAEPRQQLRI